MTTEDKLLTMVNSPDYKSKIKMYTNKCEYLAIKSSGEIINLIEHEPT